MLNMNYAAHDKKSSFMKYLWILLAFAALAGLGSCRNIMGKRVRGSGNIHKEERPVNNFKEVEVGGAAKVRVLLRIPRSVNK